MLALIGFIGIVLVIGSEIVMLIYETFYGKGDDK